MTKHSHARSDKKVRKTEQVDSPRSMLSRKKSDENLIRSYHSLRRSGAEELKSPATANNYEYDHNKALTSDLQSCKGVLSPPTSPLSNTSLETAVPPSESSQYAPSNASVLSGSFASVETPETCSLPSSFFSSSYGSSSIFDSNWESRSQ